MSFQKLRYLFEICPPPPKLWPFGHVDPLVTLVTHICMECYLSRHENSFLATYPVLEPGIISIFSHICFNLATVAAPEALAQEVW